MRSIRPATDGRRALAVALLLAALPACQTLPGGRALTVIGPGSGSAEAGAGATAAAPRTQALPGASEATDAPDAAFSAPGTGRFVRTPRAPEAAPAGERIKLNFEGNSLAEVVKAILGDTLGLDYVIDPAVDGAVTLHMSAGITREALLPTLELLLRMNGAALVDSGDLLQIVPADLAVPGRIAPQLGDSTSALPRGFSVRIVPLRYVAATEMQAILEPFAVPGNIVRVDARRNLLILAGTREELETLTETVRVFDVDWLAGQSVALFTPDYVDARTLAEDLGQIFGDQASGPLAGLVRLVTIERLDALLAISPRPEYLDKVAAWVQRLDRETGAVGQRLFIYHVQNGKAADLAQVLNQVFDTGNQAAARPAEVAPALEAVAIESPPRPADGDADAAEEGAERSPRAPRVAVDRPAPRAQSAAGLEISKSTPIRIIADEVNNALLIMATGQQYRQVQAALADLDIIPLQVLIEATIAEVTLTGDLSLGLEWFFKNHVGNKSGTATLDLNATAGLAAVVPGFSYALTDSANVVRSVLNTLASESKLNVVSSPSLMVLNNQKATIQVGDQVPITTQQQQSTAADANVINNIEFRDTGVLLSVTPRVNAGGLVIMELEQEVSDVAPDSAGTLTPTIQQRKINSTVAVQSGRTVVLGGLIRENKNRSQAGIPGLHKLPVVGLLFGRDSVSDRRTELVVLITPRAIKDARGAQGLTDEFRRKMESLKPLYDGAEPPTGNILFDALSGLRLDHRLGGRPHTVLAPSGPEARSSPSPAPADTGVEPADAGWFRRVALALTSSLPADGADAARSTR